MGQIDDLQKRYAKAIAEGLAKPHEFDMGDFKPVRNLERTYGVNVYGGLGFFAITSVFIRDDESVKAILIHNRTDNGYSDSHEATAQYVKSKLSGFDCALEHWSHFLYPDLDTEGKYIALTNTSTEEFLEPMLFRVKQRAIVQCLRSQRMRHIDIYHRAIDLQDLYCITSGGVSHL